MTADPAILKQVTDGMASLARDKKSRVGILIKHAAKRQLVRDVVEQWYRKDPALAREIVRYIREITAQDWNPRTGEWNQNKVDKRDGFLKIRFPTDLFFMLRAVMPDWGDDDADIKDLIRECPDLIPKQMHNR